MQSTRDPETSVRRPARNAAVQPTRIGSRSDDDRHGHDLGVVPRMVLQQVRFQPVVVVSPRLQQQLPLLPGPELPEMPEGGDDRADDLGTCCQPQ